MLPKINASNLSNILLLLLGVYLLGRYIYLRPQFGKGEMTPEITAVLQNGEAFQLSDLRGQYVLLDFWGSWCGPCRKDNPKLVALYKKYHGQQFEEASDFEIVSVAIEQNRSAWQAAIRQDELRWPYHIGLFDRFESEIAQAFGVRSIPTKYLLDENGTIIGVNQSAAAIDRFLAKHLAEAPLSAD